GSTQLKGVTPDIILPDSYEYIKFREKDNPTALAWDQISKADYTEFNSGINWQTIEQKEDERIKKDSAFSLIKANTDWIEKNADKTYSLNIDDYKKEQNLIKKTAKQNESLIHLSKPLDIQPLLQDRDKFYNNADTVKGSRNQQWLKNIQLDIYINETMNIVDNMAGALQATDVKN
ncbi:MAG: carboxy terminal-processing peptidase, partial [Parafilimonas sp.]